MLPEISKTPSHQKQQQSVMEVTMMTVRNSRQVPKSPVIAPSNQLKNRKFSVPQSPIIDPRMFQHSNKLISRNISHK